MTTDYAARRARAKEQLAKTVDMPGIRPRIKRYMEKHLIAFIDDVFTELEAGTPLYDIMADAEQVFVKIFSFMVSLSNHKEQACAFYIKRLGHEFQDYLEFTHEYAKAKEAKKVPDTPEH